VVANIKSVFNNGTEFGELSNNAKSRRTQKHRGMREIMAFFKDQGTKKKG
jgi:hypothetical protein